MCLHSPSLQISPSTAAMETCVEEAEVRAFKNVTTQQIVSQIHECHLPTPQFNNKIKSELNSAYAHLRIFAS